MLTVLYCSLEAFRQVLCSHRFDIIYIDCLNISNILWFVKKKKVNVTRYWGNWLI